MGVLHKAEDLKLKRIVALKFLLHELIEDPEHKARFLRETQAAAALDHSNICTVHEIDEVEGETFIAMAFLEGQTVKDKIAERPLKSPLAVPQGEFVGLDQINIGPLPRSLAGRSQGRGGGPSVHVIQNWYEGFRDRAR